MQTLGTKEHRIDYKRLIIKLKTNRYIMNTVRELALNPSFLNSKFRVCTEIGISRRRFEDFYVGLGKTIDYILFIL